MTLLDSVQVGFNFMPAGDTDHLSRAELEQANGAFPDMSVRDVTEFVRQYRHLDRWGEVAELLADDDPIPAP